MLPDRAGIEVNVSMQDELDFVFDFVEGLTGGAKGSMRQLAPNQIVIATGYPDAAAGCEQKAALTAMLSEDERLRLARFRYERDRVLFLVSHALVRMTLSRYADVEPNAWRFQAGSHGRPEIAEPQSRLRFSMSRRHGLAACAVVLDRDIGLDVEHIAETPPLDVAERFFSQRERSRLRQASPDASSGLFFEYWTLKEAYIKARGVGLSLPLDRFSIDKNAEGCWHIVLDEQVDDHPQRWRFWSWRVTGDHQMALAINRSGASGGQQPTDHHTA